MSPGFSSHAALRKITFPTVLQLLNLSLINKSAEVLLVGRANTSLHLPGSTMTLFIDLDFKDEQFLTRNNLKA